ncbi:MAG TPA: cyclopropane fatty acyl phospholipid synthase [Desulfomonilaceae bacterium]|nr:cyclopropane fatty acyl phospholipid synthase [Desulfomonilaceae bacterium]
MAETKRIVQELLNRIGVKVDGRDPWDIQVHDDRFYSLILKDKNLGLGESYMDGWWDCRRPDEFLCRILLGRMNEKVRGSLKMLLPLLHGLLFNVQSRRRSHKVVQKHYNLDNELFLSFLDPYNQYSCAYFNGTDDLNEAQTNKLELIAKKIRAHEGGHVLDVGSGWGGLAKYLAEKYACTVTGINLSEEQITFAREFCRGLPVDVLYCDYRDVSGEYDKIVSVGMFEHVGYKNYRAFMQVIHSCLKNGGVFLLHTIGGNESDVRADPWIAKYIFPNSMLPSLAQITDAAEGLFLVEDFHNFGPHYDKTLMSWHGKFLDVWPLLQHKYDERFKRMWEYYLLSCAAAFRARYIHVWQLVLTKYGTPQPQCRYA